MKHHKRNERPLPSFSSNGLTGETKMDRWRLENDSILMSYKICLWSILTSAKDDTWKHPISIMIFFSLFSMLSPFCLPISGSLPILQIKLNFRWFQKTSLLIAGTSGFFLFSTSLYLLSATLGWLYLYNALFCWGSSPVSVKIVNVYWGFICADTIPSARHVGSFCVTCYKTLRCVDFLLLLYKQRNRKSLTILIFQRFEPRSIWPLKSCSKYVSL